MISMRENEELGELMPKLHYLYSDEQVREFVDECRRKKGVSEFDPKYKKMIERAKAVNVAKTFDEVIKSKKGRLR